MATSNTAIKITSLPNIGNNIAPTTLIPVVNMAGVPTTQKANLQIAGNLILAGAGGANFVPAALANLAYTVVNSNQSNITRVGTLNISTFKVSGGTNGQYLQTDGAGNLSWATGSGGGGNGTPGGSNTQIQFNDSGAFGGNVGFAFNKTTGIFTSPFVAGNGNGLSNIQGANVSGAVGLATYAGTANAVAGTNVSGAVSFAGTANSVAVANVVGIGNIATVALNGNGSQVLLGNGTWGNGSTANTGNLSFTSNAMYNLGGVIVENADLTHGATAALVIPNNANTTQPLQLTNGYGNVVVTAGINTDTVNWTFDGTGNLTVPGNIVGPANANVIIYANAGVHQFTFGDDGTFYAPENVVLGGPSIFIGAGANTLTGFDSAVFLASSNSTAYVQAAIVNVSDIGSADYAAYGHRGNDLGGWIDLGFTSSAYSDANYTITGPGDGSLLVETFYDGQSPGGRGGNLIIGTGSQGTVNDIIFGTGGFLAENEFGRISDANNALEFTSSGNITGANVISANTFLGTGNLIAGNISTSGNVTAGSLKGDGGNISNIRGSNVNGAVSFATTANSVAAANVSGLGNLALINKDGNASNVLYGNGVFASVPATYGNSNVANYLPNYTGTLTSVGAITANGTVTANNITSNGNVTVGTTLTVWGSNNTIGTTNGSAVQFANRVNFNATGNYSIVASGNVSASYYFGTIGTASQPNITSLGNLTSVVVTSNANIGGNLVLSNTTSIVSTPSSNGNITLDPDGTGVVNIVGAATANGNISTTSGTFVGNGAGLTNVTVNAAGNIQGTSSNVSLVAGSYTYTFDNTGVATMPGTVSATGNINGTAFAVGNGAVNNCAIAMTPTAGIPGNYAIRDYSTANSVMFFDTTIGSANTGGSFQFRSSNAFTVLANINTYGVVQPTKPGFRVYGAGTTNNLTTTVNTNGILTGNNYAVDYNQGGYLNTTTGIFTAPVAGLYSVHLVARVSNTSSAQIAIVKNYASSNTVQAMWEAGANCTANHFGVSSIAKLAVGDTLVIRVLLGQINFDSNDNWAIAFLG